MNNTDMLQRVEQLEKEITALKSHRGFKGFLKKSFSKMNVLVGISITVFLTSAILWAATVSKQHGDFTDGTVISAEQVNDQINDLYTLVNGNLDDDNISATADIAQSKISGAPFASATHSHTNIVWSTGSTNTSYLTVSTDWTEMPDLDSNPLSITTNGNPVRFGFRGNFDADGTYRSFFLKITVDGSACGNVSETAGFGRIHDTENSDIYDSTHVEGLCNVDAGVHEIKMWYKMGYSSSTQNQLRHHSDLGKFLFWVEEL